MEKEEEEGVKMGVMARRARAQFRNLSWGVSGSGVMDFILGPCERPRASGRSVEAKVHFNSGENKVFLPGDDARRCK